jgi:hypothetical protein
VRTQKLTYLKALGYKKKSVVVLYIPEKRTTGGKKHNIKTIIFPPNFVFAGMKVK